MHGSVSLSRYVPASQMWALLPVGRAMKARIIMHALIIDAISGST
jgi:hypothetical protein